MLIENLFIVNNFVVCHYKLRFRVPLMVGDVVPLIKEIKCQDYFLKKEKFISLMGTASCRSQYFMLQILSIKVQTSLLCIL